MSRVVFATIAFLVCGAAETARAQILLDTFTDGIPGQFWHSESGNPALQTFEANGVLQFTCADAPGLTTPAFAGYAARNWRIRTTSEFRMRIAYSSFPVGIDFNRPGSSFGISVMTYDSEAIPFASKLRPGLGVYLGALAGTTTYTREFRFERVTPAGDLITTNTGRWFAFPDNLSGFYWQNDPDVRTTIGLQGTLFIRYQPTFDRLIVSVSGYNDQFPFVQGGVTGGTGRPLQIALGAIARQPGGTGANVPWFDDFRVDSGIVETAPVGFAASDGAFTDRVRLTWSQALGTNGYRILRAIDGGTPQLLATLGPATIGYDDLTAEPAVAYTYTIETVNPAGPPFTFSDLGYRTIPGPTGLVATSGSSIEGVRLDWDAVDGVYGYAVERRLGIGLPVEIGAPDEPFFVDTLATPGVVYTYTVRARIPPGLSAPSASVTGWRGLAPPAELVASDGTSTATVQLSWQPSAGATSYRIFRAIGAATPAQVGTTSGTTFSNTNAAPGTVYAYTVRAVAAAGISEPSEPDTGWRNVAAPGNLQASKGTSTEGVSLSWKTIPNALGYRVYRAIGGGTPELVAEAETNAAFDDSAEVGILYTYTVRGVIAAGETLPSAAQTGWRNLPAPTGLAATDGASVAGVDLSWDFSELATGYRVYRAVGNGALKEIGQAPANGFTDSTAAAGTLYTYAVRARTEAGNSAPSATDSGWRNRPAPTGVAATDGTLSTGVRVSWNPVAGASGYRVLRSLGGESPAEIAAPKSGPFLDTTAIAGETYLYAVRTRSAAGDSEPSVPDTGYRSVPAPIGVAATDGTRTDGVEITWTPVPGATGYRVFRALGNATPIELAVVDEASYLDEPDPTVVYRYSVVSFNAFGASASSAADPGWRNLSAPTGLVASEGSLLTGVSLAWEPVDGATGYRVFRALGAATPVQIASLPATATDYLDTTAARGSPYTYVVRGSSAAGLTAASEPANGWRNVAPPTNLQATKGTLSTGVNLTWTGSTGAAGYRVYRSIGEGTPTPIAEPTAKAFLDTTADVGVTYTYEVRARTAAGESNGPHPSDTGSRTMPAPSGIAASDGTSPEAVVVSWNPIPGVATYRIYRADGNATPTTPVGEVFAGASFADTSAAVGAIYNYSVRGVLDGAESAAGTANSGWRTIDAPATVAATDGTSAANVTVTWSPVTGTLDYRVYRAPLAGGPIKLVGTVNAALNAFVDASASPGVPFLYTVHARVTPGLSLPSPADEGWRDVVAPTSLTATAGTLVTGVNLAWSASSGSNGFVVLRGESEDHLEPIHETAARNWSDTTAEPGVGYFYRVRCLTPAGPSNGPGTPVRFGWRNVPAPADFAASDGTSTEGVVLGWTAVPGATSYRLERVGTAAPLATVTDTTFLDGTVAAGVVANYRITALTPSGPSLASATNPGWRNVPAPTSLVASDGTGVASVTLAWTGIGSVPGHTGYRIYRGVGSATPTVLATVPANRVDFTDTGAVPGRPYVYSVRSLTAAGESLDNPSDDGWRNVSPPANLEASDGTLATGVQLAFATVAQATGYRILRGPESAAPGELEEIAIATASPFLDDSAEAGIVYRYAVVVRTEAGDSARSPSETGWRNVPAPAAFAAGDGTSVSDIRLSWEPVPGATGYLVFRANGTAVPNAQIAEIDDPDADGYVDASVQVTGSAAGTIFNYRVRAKTAAGVSAPTAADTGWRNVPAPASLTATEGTRVDHVTLTWTGIGVVPGHTGFRIYRASGSAAPALLATVAALADTYPDATAVPGTPYAYTIRSVTAAGESLDNPIATGWRNVVAPTGLTASDDDPERVRVAWNQVPGLGVIGYAIYRQLEGEEDPIEIGFVGGTPPATTFNDVGIEPGVVGTYLVRARTAAGLSAPSGTDTGLRPLPLAGGSDGDGDGRDGVLSTGGGVPFAGAGLGKDGPAGGTGDGGAVAPDPDAVADDTLEPGPGPSVCDRTLERVGLLIAELVAEGSPEAIGRAAAYAELLGDPADPAGSPACRRRAGDVDLDGTIGWGDLEAFFAAWTLGDLVVGDLDRDGTIDERDADLLIAALIGCDPVGAAE